MHLSSAFLSLLFALSLVAASPVDRVKLEKLKRQNEGNVIQVTVTDLYTVTVSSTVPQSTTTVTVVAAVGDAVVPPAITTSTTSTTAAPVAADTPVAPVQPPTSPTTSSDSPAATTPSPNSDAPSSGGSSSPGSTYAGQGTFYDTGLGSCGITSEDTDFICAIGHALYDSVSDGGNPNNSPFCGKRIKASSSSGASVIVTVVDRCTGCSGNDIDFSPAAFQQLASESAGRIPITWEFIS